MTTNRSFIEWSASMVPNFEFCRTLLCKGWIGLQKANNFNQLPQLFLHRFFVRTSFPIKVALVS
jgi:hypothetical protein